MHEIPSLDLIEAKALSRQQTAFCVLTLFVIAILLLLHTLFASLLGEPSTSVVVLLGLSFSIKVLEFVWLQGRVDGIAEKAAQVETVLSIAGMLILSGILAFLTNRDDSPYFVLLAIPILQTAYYFGWVATLVTICVSIGMNFFWITHYFLEHPPPRATEFLEVGLVSIIYALMGLRVWFLVHQLKQQQAKLHENMAELQSAREKLLVEEKLAAVGRLASGIAHEIRNPVAMISSSLATAANSAVGILDREEMVQIAAREATRLEKLTTEFLSYARPSIPRRSLVLVNDLLSYVADAVKAHAASRAVEIVYAPTEDILVKVDSAQVQGALLNLALNGIDAAKSSGVLALDATRKGPMVQIDIQNTGDLIPDEDLSRIFEPFYSTKPTGTGLGLAIARRVAQDHGGEIWVSCNRNKRVVFSMTISSSFGEEKSKES
jgi:two-component system sensor histidine kinase HydH